MVRNDFKEYTPELLKREAPSFFELAGSSRNLEVVRERLFRRVTRYQYDVFDEMVEPEVKNIVRVRDCTRAMRSILRPQSDRMAGFSVTKALYDIARGRSRPGLEPGFFADLYHIFMGMQGKGIGLAPVDAVDLSVLRGRKAAVRRSNALDKIWRNVEHWMSRYDHGLMPEVVERRKKRRRKIMRRLNASPEKWNDWRWQMSHTVKKLDQLERLVTLSDEERDNIERALAARLPFGVTPYYLSLMDDDFEGRDRTIRAQVFPPANYVEEMAANRGNRECAFDFMLERDTSPIDLITRRYATIVILKPYNTCPQICVYCQRNWEIKEAMETGALAPRQRIEKAIEWIEKRPSIHEVLITGGDPFALKERTIAGILERLSKIKSIDHIRFGTRTPATVPMRMTNSLLGVLKKYHRPGRQDISIVTHVEHPYEITPELAASVSAIRSIGISVYNQQVFTFYNSRRFESTLLRRLTRRVGIEPYYQFNTKGKGETRDYIVPIARLLQEVNEEARLLPGLSRTDEPIYNVPGLGKNYLRARQHRDLVSILPDGSRVYEFHPWDRMLFDQKNYVGVDVSILNYLNRLRAIGEDIDEYKTIWYYY